MQRYFFLEDEDNDRKRAYSEKEDVVSEEEEEESKKETPKNWVFRVRVGNLRQGEVVCVTGNVPELGDWVPEKCLQLHQECDPNIWSKEILLPDKHVQFRYCVCVVVENGIQVIVRNWETFKSPRSISKGQQFPVKKPEPDLYGSLNCENKIDRGWLIKETAVQFVIAGDPLTIWKSRYVNRNYFIKVTPINLQRHNSNIPKNLAEALEDSLSADTQECIEEPRHGFVEVASLNAQDNAFQPQPQFGVEIKNDDLLIFHCTLLFSTNIAFLIDLYTYSSKAAPGEPPYHAAFSYVLPSAFTSSEGFLSAPLSSTKQRPLGEIRLNYLIIRPMGTCKCDMSDTYTRHWNKKRQGLDVGHRGAGNSYAAMPKNCAEIRENTIASMKTAINHGADFVEFDVQLSKDLIPVIYHDFHVCISLKKKRDLDDHDLLQVAVKELTLQQLQLLKVYHMTEAKLKTQRFYDEDFEDHQPFPTLRHALEILNPHVGFNIEIKWTMELLDGSYELTQPLDLNMYLDIILEVVMNHAENRRIIFSCFHPDICTLLRLKQNKYPVMFLTQGQTEKWPLYRDLRTRSIPAAAQFASMLELLGVCAHTEDILKNSELVNYVKEAGLVMFCWGDDNADPHTINYLKDLGLHGVIYDKIYDYQTKDKTESIFLVEARESQKDIYRLAACKGDTKAIAESRPKEKVLDFDLARKNLPTLSTATSIESLESKMSDYAAKKANT